MPPTLAPTTKHLGRCRSSNRPRAFSVTICGRDRNRSFPNGRAESKSAEHSSNAKPGHAPMEFDRSKLRKGTVLVEENADGSVLFQFEPSTTHSQKASEPAMVTRGKQHNLLAKLQDMANGENLHHQLKYRLWHPPSKPTSATDTASPNGSQRTNLQSSSHSLNRSAEALQAGSQRPAESEHEARAQQLPTSRNGSTTHNLSQLLGHPHSSSASDRHQQPEPSEQYAFASTSEPSGAHAQPTPYQKPTLLQKPRRPPVAEPGPSTPLGQDTAHSTSWAERKEEKKVPCYLWHESGLPKRVDLQNFPTETSDDADESVSSSDAPLTIADSSAALNQSDSSPSTSGNPIHTAWEPIRQILLRVWRVFPYWFRKMLVRLQRRHAPSVHASKILAQHAMSPNRRDSVAGSSFNVVTGRSPTPLIDLDRHQIEMLVDMGIGDVQLYRTALTSPSAVSSENIVADSFDRLEFLGDAVVNLIFKSWVFNRFPKDDEGSMTNTANTLVSNRAHVQYANQLHLTSYIAQNLKYMRPTTRVDEDIIADAFEALVGAIYLDRGFQAASNFVITLAEEVMGLESELSSYRNYKLYLVNNVNHADLGRVSYISKKRGNMWQSKVRLKGKLLGIGLDRQRKQAESAAAYAAIETLGFEDYAVEPVGLRPNPGPPSDPPAGLSPGHASNTTSSAPPQTASKQQVLRKM